MEVFDADPEMLRLAADFVQRREPVVNVKGGVLEPLRHDRPGALLKFQNEMHVRGARLVVEVFRKTEKQNVAQKIEDRFFDRRVAPFRGRDRALDDRAILLAHRLPGRDVSAVNRETGDRFAHGAG